MTVDQVLDTIRKGIRIALNIPLTGGAGDLKLAMMLLLKATIYARSLKKFREALKVYQKAAEIVNEIQGTRLNTQTLLDNIVRESQDCMNLYEAHEGKQIDIDTLSQEEDADIKEDFKPQLELMWCTQPMKLVQSQIPEMAELTSFNLTMPLKSQNE